MGLEFGRIARGAILSAGLAFGVAGAASAQDYPHDTVTLVTHSSAGGGTDVFLREMVGFLGKAMGANFVVENVTGGSGANAMAKLATSPADGSIFYGTTPTYINTSLLSNPEYDFTDLEGVVNVFMDPQIVFVKADSPYQSLTDLIEAAKADPTAVPFGVTTPGSLDRQVMEQFKAVTGVTSPVITHDGGGELLISVLNGTVAVAIGEIQELGPQIEAGEIRLLASYTEDRLPRFPDLPTAREQGVDLVVNKFRGIAGPRGIPQDVKDLWAAGIARVLEDPDFKAWYEAQSLVPTLMPAAEYEAFLNTFAEDQKAFLIQYGILKQ
ncbi:tripartite tricarboxylate transporter substrate binding protein [Aliigemmobacter aestuarii]|uniref:Tripartite tricarboxylate transporter substrate binding protein n=1 Tax=Aliigemmobacter aestuarii TaxID=1445661 RepID=A0A4S3MM12_9RHOB|nr:tripartite tricarboxylate transporter substrate binding protein [Gemmobacter aestuarii]THD82761.1 tripartite tricarboxylate transporter substrate binding protein [Gemmobacter aestuarii]